MIYQNTPNSYKQLLGVFWRGGYSTSQKHHPSTLRGPQGSQGPRGSYGSTLMRVVLRQAQHTSRNPEL